MVFLPYKAELFSVNAALLLTAKKVLSAKGTQKPVNPDKIQQEGVSGQPQNLLHIFLQLCLNSCLNWN